MGEDGKEGAPVEDEAILDLFFARSEEAIRAVEQKYGRLCRGLCGHHD